MATLARTRAAGNNCGDSLSNREPRLSAGFNAWIIVAAICLGTSCQPSGKVAPLPPHFSVLAADKVPLILVGQVLQDARPVATPETSEWNGRPMQLWKVRVRVEQVLQGDVSAKEVNIFYFVDMGMIESSDAPLRGGIYAHHSEIFFLQTDGGRLRTICDGWRNCVLWVRTGSHFNFKIDHGLPVEDTIVRLLLSRGNHTTDKQMIDAIYHPELRWGMALVYNALEQLAAREKSDVVRTIVREELRKLKETYGVRRYDSILRNCQMLLPRRLD